MKFGIVWIGSLIAIVLMATAADAHRGSGRYVPPNNGGPVQTGNAGTR